MRRRVVPFVLLLLLLLPLIADGQVRRRAVRTPQSWAPQCNAVAGLPAVAMSTTGGVLFLPRLETLDDVQIHTFGVAPTSSPDRLLAITARFLLTSNDGGCSWAIDSRLTFPDHLYRLVPAGARGTLAWSMLRPEIYFISDDGFEVRTAPTPLPLQVALDPDEPSKLVVADDQGAIWWSDDAGATWRQHATAPARAPLYALAFSNRGRAHAIATGTADGAHVTFDGGATWRASTGLERLNVFSIAFSPLNPDVVWAVAIDPLSSEKSRRAIHRSADGGRTFRRVLAASPDLPLKNGFTLAPSPVDETRLYFALPGTYLYLIDDEGTIRMRSVLAARDVDTIAFSPANPRVMYFGLKLSDMSAQATQ